MMRDGFNSRNPPDSTQEVFFTASAIREHLHHRELHILVRRSVTSTNTALLQIAAEGAPHGTVLIAHAQTAGRGRAGRSFFSPDGTGLYFSLLLRQEHMTQATLAITATAAVAVAEVLEEFSGESVGIKWVNDVFIHNRKVGGILTESVSGSTTGRCHVVTGVGINLLPPQNGFPENLRDTAGAVFDPGMLPASPCRILAAVLDRLIDYCTQAEETPFYESYVRRSLALGRPLRVLLPGQAPLSAVGVGIDRDFSLLVRLNDGRRRALRTGEVHILLSEEPPDVRRT